MTKKSCIPGSRNVEDLHLWTKSLPFKNLNLGKNSVLCVKHWPDNYAKLRARGKKERPKDPPSVPTPPNPPRQTQSKNFAVSARYSTRSDD